MIELVSKYHPDKICDYVSDFFVDALIELDSHAHVAVECFLCGYTVILGGEIASEVEYDALAIAREALNMLGLSPSKYEIVSLVRTQSPEINRAVGDAEGAGDQGFVWGFATNDTSWHMLPSEIEMAQTALDELVRNKKMFQGDAKIMVSDSEIVFSACHYDEYSLEAVRNELKSLLGNCGFDLGRYKLTLNPSGRWTVGGSEADTGLTGRKIVCDAYGSWCPVGGGALSGKDLTKVDRSGAYYARMLAKKLVTANDLDNCYTRLSFAIGDIRILEAKAWTVEEDGKIRAVEIGENQIAENVGEMIRQVNDGLLRPFSLLAQGNHMLYI